MKLKCIFSFIDAATNTLSSCLFLYVQQVSKEMRHQSFNVDCKLMLIGGAVVQSCSKSGGMFLQPCVSFVLLTLSLIYFLLLWDESSLHSQPEIPFFFKLKYDYDLDSREIDEKVLMCNQIYMNN